ncbi:helix-turn-helix transcriptional regulator [Bradyrhizobium sp. LHD-71]|uniref:AraC family transcriptional regulator n=1 Tax=Bradyrhizobium sp. LHD-71 TaxID=3072141 RepID=UPI00280C46E7|nr:helix-turn-helix transcriptional regulator [Bradyrhizobium sp. LHD-71]MDQ8730245.1 helix-turn-helix transcriptional regulator [Bradyrhizobium sp. LHD-71]
MPILTDLRLPADFTDPDDVARTVVTVGLTMVTTGIELDFHHHRKAQLLLSMRGVLTCELEGGLWIVPPQSAIWIPGGLSHSIRAAGAIEGYNAFIEPRIVTNLPPNCCTISVTPLLRELLIRSASFPLAYPEGGMETHLVALLLDEIAMAQIGKLHLPMPTDHRLRKIVDMMMADPSDQETMEVWARRAGLSERTLARMIAHETGMTFSRWRQQLNIMLALQWLAAGATIQQVAIDLGYESASSFTTMFRKALGTSPGRYMAERQGTPAGD